MNEFSLQLSQSFFFRCHPTEMRVTEPVENMLAADGIQVESRDPSDLVGLSRFGVAYKVPTAIAAVSPAAEANMVSQVGSLIKQRAQMSNYVSPRIVNITADVTEDLAAGLKTVNFTFYA
jgi:hypothetical protein